MKAQEKFAGLHANLDNYFNLEHHLIDCPISSSAPDRIGLTALRFNPSG